MSRFSRTIVNRSSSVRQRTKRITIRRTRTSDGKIFLTLVDALADFEKLKRPTKSARHRLLRDGFGKNKRFDSYLAFFGNIPVGYAIVFETYSSFLARPTLYLEDIFILPPYRGQGLGYGAELTRHLKNRILANAPVRLIRFYEGNVGSERIARELDFDHYGQQAWIYL